MFPVPSNFEKFTDGDIRYLLGDKISDIFAEADYRICNLEGALTDGNGKCQKTGPVIKAPTSTISAFKELGIDCCTLANNHITDAGHQGVVDTIATLDKAGIKYIGAGVDLASINDHLKIEINGRRITLYNVAETMYNEPGAHSAGANLYDEYLVCKRLEELSKDSDFLIVIYHGGVEKFRFPSPQTRKRFHRMVDCGANMVLSQHTHCVGSEEYYKGAYLLYGQGNFLFRSFNNEYTDTGLFLDLTIKEGEFEVKKHMVRAIEDTARYDEAQDFSAFDERSGHISDEEYVQQKFDEYCMNELPLYLTNYTGKKTIVDKIRFKFFPDKNRERILNDLYTPAQMLFTLHSLRSEQNREVAINGLKQQLQKLK